MDSTTQSILITTLDMAVPFWIEQLKDVPFEELQSKAKECASVVAEHGDNLLFRSKKKGDTAKAFNALAEGIAVLSFVPGGVTVFGRHWETKYEDQPAGLRRTNDDAQKR